MGSICAKTLTGTLVLQEVQRRRIALDTIAKPTRSTVAMLLNMSSGIADFVNDNFLEVTKKQREHPKHVWKPATQIWVRAMRPGVPLHCLSNTNTIMLSSITKVAGELLVWMKRPDPERTRDDPQACST